MSCVEIKLKVTDLSVGLPRIGVKTGLVAPSAFPIEVEAMVDAKNVINKDFRVIGFANQLLISTFEYSDNLALLD